MTVEDPSLEEEREHRSRVRHVRTAITLLVLVAFVVGAAYYGVQNLRGSDDAEAAPCPVPTVSGAPAPADIVLRVMNATVREGLAGSVADQLGERGLTVHHVGNDNRDEDIGGTAVVRVGEANQQAAEVIAGLVPGAEIVVIERQGPEVDLVLGEAFTQLGAEIPEASAEVEQDPAC